MVARGPGTNSANLVMPLYQQPRLTYNYTTLSSDVGDRINSKEDVIVGAFFHDVSHENYFFSFNYHVFSDAPYLIDTNTHDIAFVDLAVAAQPKRLYRLGFVLLSPVINITTKELLHYQCSFAISYDQLWITADYEWIYNVSCVAIHTHSSNRVLIYM